MNISGWIIAIACITLPLNLALTVVGSDDHLRVINAQDDDGQQTGGLRRTARDKVLLVREGSPFKIALFADLHFGENAWTDWGPEHDLKSVRVMTSILNKEQPDFVVYLGDVVTANNVAMKNATAYWDQAISPTRERNIPWASVFGNHDDTSFVWPTEWFSTPGIPPISYTTCSVDGFKGTTRLELIKNEIKRNVLSHTKSGPENLWPSVSNYVLQLSSSNDTESPVAFMYFFDSGGGSYPGVISSAQADWFRQISHEINPDLSVPEIIFWHIPSKAYKKAAPKVHKRKSCVGTLFEEDVAYQEAEFGIMKILEDRVSVKAIFVGHNHGLDWCCPNKKMWLCFARHTGYGGYGIWDKGSRILKITVNPFTLSSWITMEDGHIHSQVILTS